MSTDNWIGLAMVVVPLAAILIYGLIVDAAATFYVLGLLLAAGLLSGVITVGLMLMGAH